MFIERVSRKQLNIEELTFSEEIDLFATKVALKNKIIFAQ
jgi:hypothetical protein